MEGESGPAQHDRIPAVSDRERINVPQVRCLLLHCRIRLPRHVHQFVPAREDQLWIDGVVRFHKPTIPRRTHGPNRQTSWIVRRFAVPQEHVVLAVHVEGLYVEVLDKPPAEGADAGEAPVSLCLNWRAPTGQEKRGGHANVGIGADPLHPQSFDWEALVDVHVGVVSSRSATLAQTGKARIPIDTAQQGNGITRVAVRVMPRNLDPQLVVTNAAEVITVAYRREVVAEVVLGSFVSASSSL